MITVTHEMIGSALAAAGLGQGHTILVHSSLSSLGYVQGGADTVIDALLALVGDSGTVLVPTLTGTALDAKDNPPAFDVSTTPCWTGLIPETFRQRDKAVRSVHPTHSVAAIGAAAHDLTKDHIDSITPCDDLSPYGKLAQMANSTIVLMGVDHQANTMLHHVEELAGADYHMQRGFVRATLLMGGQSRQRHYLLHDWGTPRNFNVIDPILSERGIQQISQLGTAVMRIIHARQMVQTVLRCLRANPRILCQT